MSMAPSELALTELEESLDALESELARLTAVKPPRPLDGRRLVSQLTQQWERANRHRLARSADDEGDEVPRREIPLPSPAEMFSRWQGGGAAWVRSGSRLELRALVLAAKDPGVGPQLLADRAFWPAVTERVRERQADQILNAAFFFSPAIAWIDPAIRVRARAAPTDVPQWWVRPGPVVGALAAEVAQAASASTYTAVLEELGLPDSLPEAFLATVARACQSSRAPELASLRTFLDRGREMGNRAVILEATREWARRAAQMGERFLGERLAIAELLRGRIGELTPGRDEARWAGLEKERGMLRTWLVGEILRVVFTHLVPDGPTRDMTAPRQLFWTPYDHAVEKIWLLVCDEHRPRLAGDEAVGKLRVHGLLEVQSFAGQAEQDALWMHLRSQTGEMVTVMEGNANMPIRLRPGAHVPPLARDARHGARVVDYYQARSVFPEYAEPAPIPHRGDWQSRARNALSNLSVYPRGGR